jgi:hypothetical protein
MAGDHLDPTVSIGLMRMLMPVLMHGIIDAAVH